MDEEKQNRMPKKIKINSKKFVKVTGYDILFKNLPPTHVKLSNTMGGIVIDEIVIELRKAEHWKNLQFLYQRLLPRALALPEYEDEEKTKEKKKNKYLG